jgi:hypothetical protein
VVVVGQAGVSDTGARSVWLGFGDPNGDWQVQRVPAQGSGETAHHGLTTQILDRLRRHLKPTGG